MRVMSWSPCLRIAAPIAWSPLRATDVGTLVRAAAGDLRGVIHAWSLATRVEDEPGAGWSHQEMGALSLMHLVQALAQRADDSRHPPALWVLTNQTQAVADNDPIDVAHSTMWGMRRVVANEHPHLSARIVDTDGTKESLAAFAAELERNPDEDELAFRKGARFVHRLRRHVPEAAGAVQPAGATDSTRMELKVGKTGDLNSMTWARLPKLEMGEHEVEIEVHATALNFKDVMKATGLFPARLVEGNLWSHETLGMECSGRVTRTGSNVAHVRPGDEVMALSPRSFASHTVTHGALVVANPGLSAAEAAGRAGRVSHRLRGPRAPRSPAAGRARADSRRQWRRWTGGDPDRPGHRRRGLRHRGQRAQAQPVEGPRGDACVRLALASLCRGDSRRHRRAGRGRRPQLIGR